MPKDFWKHVNTTRNWVTAAISFLPDLAKELFKHRLMGGINDYLDVHAMKYAGPILLFIAHWPFLIPAIVIALIFLHAYLKTDPSGKDTRVEAETASPRSPSGSVVGDGDPRIFIEFVDERKNQLYKKTALMVVNRGGSEALDVQIEEVQLRGQKVRFPKIAGAISANGGSERFDPKTDGQYGGLNTALFVDALKKEWDSYDDINMEELEIPLKVSYTNFSRSFTFISTCSLVFHPFAEILHHAPENQPPIVSLRDFVHTKKPA